MNPNNPDISVYVTNFSGIDLTDALQYMEGDGEIVYITEGKTSIFNHDSLLRRIRFAIKGMKESDYILVAGNAVIAVYCVAEAIKKFGFVKLLIWDNNKPGYRVRILNEKE